MSTNYDFQNLSYEDFERLTKDLLSIEWNIPLETFKTGKDKGIDLRYSHPTSNSNLIIQCKRYSPNAFNSLLNKLKNEEIPKIKALNPERYVLVTSVPLSVGQKDKLYEVLKPWCKSTGDIFGADEINALIRNHGEIEKKHFKLWIGSTEVLESIFHSGIWNRTFVTIEEIQKEISKFVTHDGLNQALKILEDKKYCIIVGLPGIGKTTLAKIALYHYIKIDFEAVVVSSDIEEAWSITTDALRNNRKLVILYDDFLGQIGFEHKKLEKNEDARLLQLLKLVGKSNNLRFILTTREYILADAKRQHALLAQNEIHLETFTLNLEHYNLSNRARILFNHIFFSDLPHNRVEAIVKSRVYSKIVHHKNYNPRIISSITENERYKHLSDAEYLEIISKEFANPSNIWDHAYNYDIRPESKQVLLLLWSFGEFATIKSLKSAFINLIKEKTPHELDELFVNSIKDIDGNFIKTDKYDSSITLSNAELVCKFHNPSIRDYINQKITSNILLAISSSISRYKQIIKLYDEIEMIDSNQRLQFCTNLFNKSVNLVNEIEEQIVNFYDGAKLTDTSKKERAERLNLILKTGEFISRSMEAFEIINKVVVNEDEWLGMFKQSKIEQVALLLSSIKSSADVNNEVYKQTFDAVEKALLIYIRTSSSIIEIAKILDIALDNLSFFKFLSEETITNDLRLLTSILLENINDLTIDELEEEKLALYDCNYMLDNQLRDNLLAVEQAFTEKTEELVDEIYSELEVSAPINNNVEIELDELFFELINH